MFEYIKDIGLKPISPYVKRKATNMIVLHHFESTANARDVHEYHISKGSKGIDYNIVVNMDGSVVWGRGLEYAGGHVSDAYFKTAGVNDRSVGIAAQGNFNKYPMSDVQKQALKRVTRDVAQYYGITDIRSHKELAGNDYTDCPGMYFPTQEIRSYALTGRSGSTLVVSRLLKLTNPMLRGEDVAGVQSALMKRGYSLGKFGADGVFGTATRSALKEFQQDHALNVDGIAGKQTVLALGGVWMDR